MRVFRRILPTETGRLRDHLLRLDPNDRFMRFLAARGEAAIADYCARIDWHRCYAIGFLVDGVLRGAAELHLDDARHPRRGELAVTVERPWQGQGIGTGLLRRAILLARNRGVRTLAMICLLDNRRMRRVAHKFTQDLRLRDGYAEADILTPFPSPLSLWEEMMAEGVGLLSALVDPAPQGPTVRTALT